MKVVVSHVKTRDYLGPQHSSKLLQQKHQVLQHSAAESADLVLQAVRETGLCKLPGWGKSSKLCLLSPLIGWLLAGQPIRELETARDTWAPPELKVSQEKMKFVFPMGRWVPVHGWFELQSPRSGLPSQDCGQNMRCSNNSDFTGKWWQNLGLHWQCMMQSLIKRLSFVCQVSDHETINIRQSLSIVSNDFCISD